MATFLMPLPSEGFDPTEAAVPWQVLSDLGHRIVFATPDGQPGTADAAMVTGKSLGIMAPLLRADRHGRNAYAAMIASADFRQPMTHAAMAGQSFDALILPGGHAKSMRPYLESPVVQAVTAAFFAAGLPVGAICHGVLVAARSRTEQGKSVLHGRKTTALLRRQELLAWNMTRLYLGDYYRTYPQTVEDEVVSCLASPEDFIRGPARMTRDTPERPDGFVVVDGKYVSARWPGDAYRFSQALAAAAL